MKPSLIILAAGIGSRYGGLKQLEPVGRNGELIIDYSIYDALCGGFEKIICVIRKEMVDDFGSVVTGRIPKSVPIRYAFQELADIPGGFSVPSGRRKQWGTAHAVYACRDLIEEPFGVINADDFYGRDSFRLLADYLAAADPQSAEFCNIPFRMERTLSENGGVSRGVCRLDEGDFLTAVAECHEIKKDGKGGAVYSADGEQRTLDGSALVSMNMWGFTPSFFPLLEDELAEFLRTDGGSERAEFYIPTVVDALIRSGRARCKCRASDEQWFGVTYPQDRAGVVSGIRAMVENGRYPEKLWQ